jgi:hypothetical protein
MLKHATSKVLACEYTRNIYRRLLYSPLYLNAASGANTTAAAATSATRRSLATVADPPVRRYGGLKDQDRIFTNLFCRGDHGLKGAQVSRDHSRLSQQTRIYI